VKRQILVNIPAQQLWAIGTDSVLDMRICCGAVPTKTPLLHSAISYMQVNPEWVIPQNIVKTEVVHHAGDSAYFARNRYSIIDKESSDTLNVSSVSADALLSGKLRVSQKGGVGNSLGRIVFRFPNDFSIYLHDTNNRSAFQRDRRTLSHGCVRVQKPFELASFLLSDVDEWTLESLRISMDIPPVTDRGREWLQKHADAPHPYRLISYHAVKPNVPLYILYYTTFPNPKTGAIDYWPDLYGFDKVISKELKWISEGSSSR
ncbi:MAG: L,D-transpeptidase family protein, partial [Prevotella sp.]|nr:L,D-transpeptidase family protein [Prevotella sp.]